ncbi:MAG: Na+-dependent nucleoside transporter [Gammaproteobacteria bacterium]|jgi:CNT family concentrative nucleoside transporter|nr:Na+-dependent nucleoside transporter [Gammaproteobacteria bacterium]MBT5216615.1 Na+-dependent nucleoside transporter [Gammaproteobacteria bacterium]MBT5541738.1 Na+-dependent nucleoside transporter [Gammaproteobacteria bacterium]MBT6073876.1 Na+-dependent nucleoside transporter [Gammaproteobacteria bacterium]MBT7753875.1 Na+-dependent nucleoside transporter [Gammaproteobacteria bacterium]
MTYYPQIIIGAFALISLGVIFSDNIKQINLKYLLNAIILQFLLAILLIKVPLITSFFESLSQGVLALKAATDQGTGFVFGYLADGAPKPFEVVNPASANIFIFSGLMLIIVVSALAAILWHWRVLPIIIKAVSTLFKKPLNIGGPVGLSATANIIFGQVEAPLLIKPYLKKMTRHELLTLMIVGMSTISGGVMVVYTTMLADLYGVSLIGHFLTASIISVPAAIMYANIMMPSDEKTEDQNKIKESSLYKSTLDALTRGTQDGLNITLSIAALLLVLIALVALVNFALTGLPLIGGEVISLERIAGWIFSPIAWCMGIPWSEAQLGGSLLGVKTILNEFVAYVKLAGINANDLSEKSRLIMLYALCGFANLSSVGILLSGISAMVPERKDDLISVSGKALVGATLASCFTGLVVGIIY